MEKSGITWRKIPKYQNLLYHITQTAFKLSKYEEKILDEIKESNSKYEIFIVRRNYGREHHLSCENLGELTLALYMNFVKGRNHYLEKIFHAYDLTGN